MADKNQVINYEFLDSFKYHELKDKFTELGVSEAWKGGASKKDMCNKALSLLHKINSLKQEGVTEDNIDKELELLREQELEAKEQAEIQRQLEEEIEQTALENDVQEKQLSKTQLEKNLDIIDRNLKNNIPGQRNILLKKREIIKTELEKFDIEVDSEDV